MNPTSLFYIPSYVHSVFSNLGRRGYRGDPRYPMRFIRFIQFIQFIKRSLLREQICSDIRTLTLISRLHHFHALLRHYRA